MQNKCLPLDPSFGERFNCSLEEITFKTPSHVSQISANACMFPEVALFWYFCDKKKIPTAVNAIYSKVKVCSYMQLVALAENVRLELEDVGSLLRLSGGDVRRCLLQLQLWVDSGGGRACQSGGFPEEPTGVQRKLL